MKTILAPGIEIREIDKSGYKTDEEKKTSYCYIVGFSNKGQPYEPMTFTSRTAWSNYFGHPKNEAEKYFYTAVCEVLNQNGQLHCARLPYDNESYNKMPGVQYKLSIPDHDSEDVLSSFLNGEFAGITERDKEIQQFGVISSDAKPQIVTLKQIDDLKAGEIKAEEGSILIVDTTGATYDKVQEDFRKGKDRECIGLVPVITTAANALYAQQVINLKLEQVSAYEPLAGLKLNTISYNNPKTGLSVSNDGLRADDFAGRLNTQGKWFQQFCAFDSLVLSGLPIWNDDPASLNWLSEDENPVALSTFLKYGVVSAFADGIIDEEHLICSDLEVSALVDNWNSCLDIPGGYLGNLSNVANPGSFASVGKSIMPPSADADKYNFLALLAKEHADEINELVLTEKEQQTINILYGTDDKAFERDYNSFLVNSIAGWVGTMLRATPLQEPEWHGCDGDDSIPDTLALDSARYFPPIAPASDGEGFDPERLKDIGVVVYKTYLDVTAGNKVSYEPVEAFCGSLYKNDKDPNTGISKFIDDIINSQSKYINFFSNCFNTTESKKWYLNDCDIIISKPSTGSVLGFFESMTVDDISISKSIYDGMTKAFDKVKDVNKIDIDMICDAGITNIASYLKSVFGDKGKYDLNATDAFGNSLLRLWKVGAAKVVSGTDTTNNASTKTWRTTAQKFDDFCKNVRKDCMFIADGLRPLVLQGQQKIVRETKPENTIENSITPYLNTITGLNSSYSALYMNWFKIIDEYSGDSFWCPPSIKAMGVYVNCDINHNYWDAPAGLNRGVIKALDLAFSPTVKQAGPIYEKSINYATKYQTAGIVLEGQRTTQIKPTALDRVNVRRLFCRLEKLVFKTSQYFLYEGNTAYTRQRFVDALDPYFNEAKVMGGIYDYRIICDETNNTPETIDRNELYVSIGIKPVKTIEFIIVDFVATTTGASWEEVGL